MMFRILAFLLLPVICLAQVNSNGEKPTGELLSNEISPNEIKRNASFNLDEIKVRWKKAALENCTGVPCIITPPPPPPPSFACGTSTISDVDGNVYETVLIGLSCWTKQNLRVTMYNDGTPIPLDASATDGSSGSWPAFQAGAYTIYDNESNTGTNATNYGFLYNWYAAAGIANPIAGSPIKNICPKGWHVPTDGEWNGLIGGLGGDFSAGSVMKSTSLLWSSQSAGTDNSSLFTALPGGYRPSDGTFNSIRFSAFFWSATPSPLLNKGYLRILINGNANVYLDAYLYSTGLSVRCLKDY